MAKLYAPLITPFDGQEELDLEGLRRNLDFYESQPLDGYVVNGSSGEAEMLNDEERLRLVRLVRESTGRSVIAGVAASSVRVALQRIRALDGLELEAVLVRTPSYFGPQFDQRSFYESLAQASPHPILIYQIPQYTGVRLNAEVLGVLAGHPNIVGIKDSLGDLALLNEVEWPPHFSYLLGAAGLLLPGLLSGCKGGILALANLVPDLCRKLCELAQDGRVVEARALQKRLIPLNRAIGGSAGFGLAGLKAGVEILGLAAGPPRAPLRPLAKEQRRSLRRIMDDLSVG